MVSVMKRLDPDDVDPARREVLRLLGSVAAAGMLGCSGNGARAASESTPAASSAASASTCVVRPQQTEGPYFVDEKLNRSDLTIDPVTGVARPGVALGLAFRVSRTSAGVCGPLVGAMVDVWQCDALGTYSDIGGSTPSKFLRGFQVTDASGNVRFSTIYPGWYTGRAVHVHFKIRSNAGAVSRFEFTSQLYFDESVTDAVHAQAPYSSHGKRDTTNQRDPIFAGGGTQLMLAVAPAGAGYSGTFDIALQV
jgi:protocatechuate 3,4-dioxygenase beta subunit